jgi:hypothetical protein
MRGRDGEEEESFIFNKPNPSPMITLKIILKIKNIWKKIIKLEERELF